MSVVTEEKPVETMTPIATNGNGHHNGSVHVRLVDYQGRTRQATLPTRLPMSQVKEHIIEQLEASPFDSNGQPVVYDLVHNGTVLTDDDTLEDVGVIPDDEVELSPSIQSA
jgi:uncharacterized ubiquitin-like protein YukD